MSAYRARRDAIRAELATMEHEQNITVDAERAAALLTNIRELCDGATDQERREIAAGIVEAVWCDLDADAAEYI